MSDTAPSADDAAALLRRHTAAIGGMSTGPIADADKPSWAAALIQQFRDQPAKRACPHLQDGSEANAVWLASAPDLLACPSCVDQVVG